ncbi:MAG TPA: pectate lyase, partial [Planctomycetota bacterium]|nr:pectate lyase [Planctomycetota bacterium]
MAFFRDKVGVEGGYVWKYSADLSKREGEGKVGPRTVWVQPPGTPFVGEAFVEIHELTGDRRYLEAAKESAQVLLRGQLRSGGWAARIELDPEERRRFAYRIDPEPRRNARNHTALDDDMTQSALRFLMRYDRATSFGDAAVHEAVKIALESLLAAQYPNGAWPQGYADVSKRPERPVRRAGYDPEGEYPKVKEYWDFYTLNDGVMKDVIDTLLIASRVYDEKRYREAALRGGEFLLLAQMPDPQPAWAQQYDFDMQPAWARRFEPPAISGGESQGVLEALLDLFDETGDRKWLEPVPRAIAYLRRSLLPDGRLARFYELRTNRPLYFTREYELTHDDSDVPTHYSFKVTSRLDRIEARLERLVERADREAARREPEPERSAPDRTTSDRR